LWVKLGLAYIRREHLKGVEAKGALKVAAPIEIQEA